MRTTISFGFRASSVVRREAHLLQRAGPEILDEDVGAVEQRLAAPPCPSSSRRLRTMRALVAAVGLPEERVAVVLPVAQRIALRRLDLDDVGAEIAELQAQHVAGDEPADRSMTRMPSSGPRAAGSKRTGFVTTPSTLAVFHLKPRHRHPPGRGHPQPRHAVGKRTIGCRREVSRHRRLSVKSSPNAVSSIR